MANDKKISQLGLAGGLDGTELVPVVKGGVTVQTTAQDIADLSTSGVQSVTGSNVDNTDPNNPVVNVSDLSQVLSEGYVANSSIQLTDGVSTELLLDPNYIQLKSNGLGSILFDADATLDTVKYKGEELATLNDIPSLTGYEQTVNKDATGGYVGLTLFKINFKNVLNTFTSFFTNSNTAARTYTFQDRNGTIADDTDLGLKSPIASPTFTGTPLAPTASAGTNNTQIATTAYVDAKGSIQNYYSGKRVTIPFAGTSSAINGWNGAIIYIPIPITSSVAFTDISQEVTALTVGSNIRLALYTSVNGLPSALLEDSGNISTSTTGIKNYVLSAPHSFTAVDKQVFVAIQSSSAAVGLRYALNTVCFNYFNGSGQSGGLFNQVQVFGAFPATATPSVYANANSPLVSLLVQ